MKANSDSLLAGLRRFPRLIRQVIEMPGAAVRCGGSRGGLRRLPESRPKFKVRRFCGGCGGVPPLPPCAAAPLASAADAIKPESGSLVAP